MAVTLSEGDDRRARLLALSRDALAEEATVRPVIAAKILGLSEKTVRAWEDAGHVLRELREEGLERDLFEHVWRRLEDQSLLDREDLRESIGQLLRGDVVVLRPPTDTEDK
ncbi:MAG TPA: hypothetical protein VG142_17855 [Trebonia sp.]|nr:hypothetical protein [Trebonia sp.]